MAEMKTAVRTFKIDYVCDECGEGRMRPSGFVYDTNPPSYVHACNKCGNGGEFSWQYPYTVTEEVDARTLDIVPSTG